MLEDVAKISHGSIVSWQPHGMSFRVHQPEVFTRTVMPRYFKQTKYKSFLRQLHLYGFHRIAKGRDRGAYIHSMFIRNKKSMSLRMTRQKIKGKNSSSKPTNHYAAGNHPDFYSSESIDVKNAQYQHRHNPTSALQSDPRMVQACTTTEESKKGFYLHDLATVCTITGGIAHHTGSIDPHADDEEKPSLVLKRAFLLNEEITTCAADAISSPSNQRIGSEDMIIDLAIIDWLELHEGDEHAHDGGEGFFAGKRFFQVAESENTVDGRFQLAL
jgi:hypothetical protein